MRFKASPFGRLIREKNGKYEALWENDGLHWVEVPLLEYEMNNDDVEERKVDVEEAIKIVMKRHRLDEEEAEKIVKN